ncbi:MAG: protein kinase domain-containing protein [Acidobacteriota bacterium]
MIGKTIGPYQIVAKLGEGGMGEVYRARDTRLGRDVAVKVLPDAALIDADRIGRFQREAQILAALNHPHIAAIYGLEELPGTGDRSHAQRFLILELVAGGTLADRLERGALPVREAMAIARQLADALQAAHDKGIIHRDLKPGNVALTPEGLVKVLDFGIAKTIVPESGDLTATVEATAHGAVIGTAAYMSPEQARGLPLDKRTDIWSFGCLLFEGLTRESPFRAPTISDTLAGILTREPDLSKLPPDTPPRVKWLLRRCLEKDTRRRLHDIADARIELDEALSRPEEPPSAQPAPTAPRRMGVRERLAWIAAAAGIVIAVLAWSWPRNAPASPAVGVPARSSILFPADVRLSVEEDPSGRFAISPDGRRLAIVANGGSGEPHLYVRPIDGWVPQPLAGTEGASSPFWSADSGSIAFTTRQLSEGLVGTPAKLKSIDLASGQITTLADVSLSTSGAWNKSGVILFTPTGTSPIHRISASGGASSPVTKLDQTSGDVQHAHPSFLPDGRHFLFSVIGSRTVGATATRGVFVGSLDGSEPAAMLLEGTSSAKYSNGHVLFVRSGRLMAQLFDVTRLRLAGDPVQLAEGVQEGGGAGGGFSVGAFSASANGLLAYQSVTPMHMQLAWFDRTGKRLSALGGDADYADVTLSRDGSRAAVSMLDPSSGTRDIWVFDVGRGTRERITSDPADDFAPVWSPTGDRLAFSSARQGRVDLFVVKSSAQGTEAPIATPALDVGKFAATWSPDDLLVFIAGGRVIARSDVWAVGVSGSRDPFAVLQSPAIETQARLSPDGRWLAYVMNVSSRREVYVQPFPGPGSRQQVSIEGGRYPQWRRDSSEIYFLAPDDRLMSAAIQLTATAAHIGAIRPLFKFQFYRYRLDAFPYDVSPDGRFLVNTLVEQTPATISLLSNWPAAVGR